MLIAETYYVAVIFRHAHQHALERDHYAIDHRTLPVFFVTVGGVMIALASTTPSRMTSSSAMVNVFASIRTIRSRTMIVADRSRCLKTPVGK
jgi:hypothetical protein